MIVPISIHPSSLNNDGSRRPDQFVVAVMQLRPLITSCQATICNLANANAHTEVERNGMHLLLVAGEDEYGDDDSICFPVEPQSND